MIISLACPVHHETQIQGRASLGATTYNAVMTGVGWSSSERNVVMALLIYSRLGLHWKLPSVLQMFNMHTLV